MNKYLKGWIKWSRCSNNSKLYRILVLFGVQHSPSFDYMRGIKDGRTSNIE